MMKIRDPFTVFELARKGRDKQLKDDFHDAMKVAVPGKEIIAFNVFGNKFYKHCKQSSLLNNRFSELSARFNNEIDINKNCTWQTEFYKWIDSEQSIQEEELNGFGIYKAESDFWNYMREYEGAKLVPSYAQYNKEPLMIFYAFRKKIFDELKERFESAMSVAVVGKEEIAFNEFRKDIDRTTGQLGYYLNHDMSRIQTAIDTNKNNTWETEFTKWGEKAGEIVVKDFAKWQAGLKFCNFLNDYENRYFHPQVEAKKEADVISINEKKLKWNGSPALLGYLLFELADKGYIEFPLYNGEISTAGLAKMSFETFKINTTKENLIKEMNPKKNTLSNTKKCKFSIPNLKDLS